MPIFFILSGYFLLTDKPHLSLEQFLKRRLTRILIPFAGVLLIYLFVRHWTVTEWGTNILTGKVSFHLWFMYSLVGLYLAVPLFEHLFASEKGLAVVKYYVAVWLAAAVLYPCAKEYWGWSIDVFRQFNCEHFFGFMGFFFVGGLLRRVRFARGKHLAFFALYAAASCCVAAMTVQYSHKVGKPAVLFVTNLSPFVVVQAAAIFAAFKDVELPSRIVSLMARQSYWMYLVHLLVLEHIQKWSGLQVSVHTALNIGLLSAGTFLGSFVVSFPLYWLEQGLLRLLRLKS